MNQALVTMISSVTRHISQDTRMRTSVARYNLVRGGTGRVPDTEDDDRIVNFDKTGYWSDILKRQFRKGSIKLVPFNQ